MSKDFDSSRNLGDVGEIGHPFVVWSVPVLLARWVSNYLITFGVVFVFEGR